MKGMFAKLTALLPLLICLPGLYAGDLTLDILFTNDTHGGIDRYEATFMNPEFPPIIGGGTSAATYIKQARLLSDKVTRDNLLIDVGDFFQGHPIGTVSKGKAIMKYFNAVDYDLLVIGNHEFDVGQPALREVLEMAEFPILSCNIINDSTGTLVDFVRPYVIREILGIKVGLIGLTTTDTALMSFPEHIKGIKFRNEIEALHEWVPKVKADGADIIILVGHLGIPYEPFGAYEKRYGDNARPPATKRVWGYDAQEIAHEVEGIDLILAGHIHKGFQEPWFDPKTHTIAVQGYAYGSNMGHLILKIDPETKTISGWDKPSADGILVTMFEEEWLPDPDVTPMIYEETRIAEAGMDEVIGESTVYLTREGKDAQNVIGNMVCDAMLAQSGADFAFVNLGGIRGEIGKGPITYRDVFDVLPFDNQLAVAEVDGRFLKEIIEKRVEGARAGLRVAGIKVVYSRKRPDMDRVTLLEIGGKPWDPDKMYKIATSDFLFQGNAGLTLLTRIPEDNITRTENNLRDEVVNYIRKNSPLKTQIDDRWVRDDDANLSSDMVKALGRNN